MEVIKIDDNKISFFQRINPFYGNNDKSKILNKSPVEINKFVPDDNVLTNGFGYLNTAPIVYNYNGEDYFNYTSLVGYLNNPGSNSYGVCVLAEKVFNIMGFYSGEINRMASGIGKVPIINITDKNKMIDGIKLKDDFYKFNEDVVLSSVEYDMLVLSQKFGVYFGYLDYKTRGSNKKRIFNLPAKYMKIIGTDGKTPLVAINLYNVVTKEKINLFPPTIRSQINKKIKGLKSKSTDYIDGDESANSEEYFYLKDRYLRIDKSRTITVINGDAKSSSWGQIQLIKAIKQIYTDMNIQNKIKDSISAGDKNILVNILPGNNQQSPTSRTKTNSLGSKGADAQHENVKSAATTTIRVASLTVAPGSKVELINIKDMFANYDSADAFYRIAFNAGIPITMLNGKAEGMAIANYSKNAFSVIHENLVKFGNEITKVFTSYSNEEERLVKLSYVKTNDYIVKDNASIASKLFIEAGGSYSRYIASTGQNPYDYIMTMDEERELGFDDKYFPHLTANNISKDDNVSGRTGESEKNVGDEDV